MHSGATAAVMTALIGHVLCAQEFEAATLKPYPSGCVSGPMTRSGIEESKGLIRIENMSLKAVIEMSYGVKDFQFERPAWVDTACFDIVAKPPASYKHEDLQSLLRNLLADRFKLSVHNDSKEMTAYVLTVAKDGPKFHEATKPRGYFTARPGHIDGARVSMKRFIGALKGMFPRPIIDETGLSAEYEIKLEWTPDQAAAMPAGDEQVPDPGVSISTALRDQLGLRLQTRKAPVEIVIVDHIEKTPTDN
jgi:uncharacterized protein (TIGR03435 family)